MILRFIIAAVVMYFILRLLGRILTAFLNKSNYSQTHPPPTSPSPKPTEEYTDVEDARFTDIEGNPTKSDAAE